MQRARESIAEIIASKIELDAVVGYDNIALTAYSSPPLTTISQDIHRAGTVLVSSLLRLINGETVEDTLLPSELVIRSTTVNGYVDSPVGKAG